MEVVAASPRLVPTGNHPHKAEISPPPSNAITNGYVFRANVLPNDVPNRNDKFGYPTKRAPPAVVDDAVNQTLSEQTNQILPVNLERTREIMRIELGQLSLKHPVNNNLESAAVVSTNFVANTINNPLDNSVTLKWHDLAKNRKGNLRLSKAAVAIAIDDKRGLAVVAQSAEISIVDMLAHKVSVVSADVVYSPAAPTMALDQILGRALLHSNSSRVLSVFDYANAQQLYSATFVAPIQKIVLDSKSTNAYVLLTDNSVHEVDITNGKTLPLLINGRFTDIAVGNSTLFALSATHERLVAVSLNDLNKVEFEMPLVHPAATISVNELANIVMLANADDDSVSVLNLATLSFSERALVLSNLNSKGSIQLENSSSQSTGSEGQDAFPPPVNRSARIIDIQPRSFFDGTESLVIQIEGLDITDETAVYAAGVKLQSQKVSATQVSATVPSPILAGDGAIVVEVFNHLAARAPFDELWLITNLAATVPGAPTIGTAIAGNARAIVSFTAPTNTGGSAITGYTATCGTKSATGSASTITVTALPNGAAVTCNVKATNAVGTGAASAASNSVIPAITVPSAPTIGTATAGNARAIVSFTAPTNTGGSAITGYTATCGTKSATGTASPITVTALPNGAAVTCNVKATNAAGTGAASAASNSITPATVPSAPVIGTATAGNASATVTFTAPTNTGGGVITGYAATCGAKSATSTSSPITVTTLTNGTAVTCNVKAINAIGTGAASAASNSVIPAITVPAAPTIGTAAAGNASATVTFTAPTNTGGSAITGYTATCGTQSANGVSSPITVSGLANGVAVTCNVKAINAVGTGAASATSNGVTPAAATTVPGAPTIGTAAAGNASVTVTFTAPTNTGGSAITGYTATCGTRSANGVSSPITVSGLTNGVAVTCNVKAINAVGTGAASAASNSITPAAVTTVPSAPTIGTAVAGNASATVTFTAPTNTGGSAITGYTATCGTQSANGVSSPITVSGLANGVAVTCNVKAINAVGAGAASAASNTVQPNADVPQAPTGVVARGLNSAIEVLFAAPPSTISPISGYEVRCGAFVTTTSGQFAIVSATNDQAVSCTVVARNSAGAGPASLPSIVVFPPGSSPNAPTIGVATAGPTADAVTVTFLPPNVPSSNYPSILGYVAMCGTESAVGTASPIVVRSLMAGSSPTCTVSAFNQVGTSAASSPSNSVAISGGVPAAPTQIILEASGNNILVRFVADAAALPISSFHVAKCGAISQAGRGSPILVTRIPNGTSYSCTVRSVNEFGSSLNSAASATLLMPYSVPAPPSAVTVEVSNGKLTVAFAPPEINSNLNTITTQYVATCGAASGQADSSPIVVVPTTYSVPITCSVRATVNGLNSPSVLATSQVTPLPPRQLIVGFMPISPQPFIPNQTFPLTSVGGASGNPVMYTSNSPSICSV